MSDLLTLQFAPLLGERPPDVPTAEAVAASQIFREGIRELLVEHPDAVRSGGTEKTVFLEFAPDAAVDPRKHAVGDLGVPEVDIKVDVQAPAKRGAESGLTVRITEHNEFGRPERYLGYSTMPSGRVVRHEASSRKDLFQGGWPKEVNQAGTDVSVRQAEAAGVIQLLRQAEAVVTPVYEAPKPDHSPLKVA